MKVLPFTSKEEATAVGYIQYLIVGKHVGMFIVLLISKVFHVWILKLIFHWEPPHGFLLPTPQHAGQATSGPELLQSDHVACGFLCLFLIFGCCWGFFFFTNSHFLLLEEVLIRVQIDQLWTTTNDSSVRTRPAGCLMVLLGRVSCCRLVLAQSSTAWNKSCNTSVLC